MGNPFNKFGNWLGEQAAALDPTSWGKSHFNVDERVYTPQIEESAQNWGTLQDALVRQSRGEGPNVAGRQFEANLQKIQAANASAIAGIRGMSPAAQARLLRQQNAQALGQASQDAAIQRMQQQLLAQQLLGQQALGMYDVATGRRLGSQQVNAGVAAQNTATAGQIIGGIAGGAGAGVGLAAGGAGGAGAAGAGGGGAGTLLAYGGEVPDSGPQSELGRMLAGLPMQAGGAVPGAAAVPGDSYANDSVPLLASPGEIVVPRSHATPEGAAAFVAALQAQKRGQPMAHGGLVGALAGRGC